MSLGQSCDLVELRPLVVERLAVTQGVEEPDEMGDEIDHVRTVGGSDLAQIGGCLTRNTRLRPPEFAREGSETGAEGGAAEDVLVDESGDLVTCATQAPLGALKRQRCLSCNELCEPSGLREIGSSSAAPALAQLGQGCGLTGDDAAAVRVTPQNPTLAQPAGIAWIAERGEVPQASNPNSPYLFGLPRHAEGGKQGVVGCGHARLEPRVEPRLPRTSPRGWDLEHVESRGCVVGGGVPSNPAK